MATEWVSVVPGPGEIKDVARALLALADDPADVRTQRNGSEFLVPADVADRYNAPVQEPVARRRGVKSKEGGK